jgi:RNase P subunit RPR2
MDIKQKIQDRVQLLMKIKRLSERNSLSGKRELARMFCKKQCSQLLEN